MSAPTTVPLTVTPAAAAQIVHLGLQAPFDRMVEHIRHTVPDLQRIEADVWYRYEMGGPDEPDPIAIDVYCSGEVEVLDEADDALRNWCVRTFGPDVLTHLGIWTHHETNHAG